MKRNEYRGPVGTVTIDIIRDSDDLVVKTIVRKNICMADGALLAVREVGKRKRKCRALINYTMTWEIKP